MAHCAYSQYIAAEMFSSSELFHFMIRDTLPIISCQSAKLSSLRESVSLWRGAILHLIRLCEAINNHSYLCMSARSNNLCELVSDWPCSSYMRDFAVDSISLYAFRRKWKRWIDMVYRIIVIYIYMLRSEVYIHS